jgi:uncharacterized membrane protein YfcA
MDNLLLVILIGVASLIQGYCGFGFGIVAMALLAMTGMPLEAVALVVTFVGTGVIAWLLWLSWKDGKVVWRAVRSLLIGALFGLPLGYVFLVRFGDQPIGRLVLGVVLLIFSLVGLLKQGGTFRVPHRWGVLMGWLSGVIGGAFVSGGPPVVIYLQGQVDDPRVIKSSIQTVFLLMMFMRIVAAGTTGLLADRSVWWLTFLAVCPAMILLWLGHWLSRFGTASFHRLAAQVMIGLFGLGLIGLNLREL